jgi:hypothetical protein
MPLRQLLDCKLSGVRVVDIATHFEKTLAQINIKHVNAGWLVFGDGFSQGMLRAAIKRVCDVIFATLILAADLADHAAHGAAIRSSRAARCSIGRSVSA